MITIYWTIHLALTIFLALIIIFDLHQPNDWTDRDNNRVFLYALTSILTSIFIIHSLN